MVARGKPWPAPPHFEPGRVRCEQYIRHQSIWPLAERLQELQLVVERFEQQEGDLVVTLSGALHYGYNSDTCVNVAQNIALTEGDILVAERSKPKHCSAGCGRWGGVDDESYMVVVGRSERERNLER